MDFAAPASRTVLVTGGTGFIGRRLVPLLRSQGWRVLAWLHRTAAPAALREATSVASLGDIPPDTRVDAIVNLAGARILGLPWTPARRRLLIDSRIGTTDALVAWMSARAQRPSVLVSASAVGYYGVRGAERIDESALPQPVFQSEICRRWEEAALRSTALGVRCVMPRLGVVLGREGGALPAFVRPARFGLAAIMGSGGQGFPWIHVDDAVALIQWALEGELHGAVNAVAPDLVSQREFQAALCEQLRRPLWLRVPAGPVRLALGEMAQLLVDGQFVVPVRAMQSGFVFRHPHLPGALARLLGA